MFARIPSARVWLRRQRIGRMQAQSTSNDLAGVNAPGYNGPAGVNAPGYNGPAGVNTPGYNGPAGASAPGYMGFNPTQPAARCVRRRQA